MISRFEKFKAKWWNQYPPTLIYSLGFLDANALEMKGLEKCSPLITQGIYEHMEDLDLHVDMYSEPKLHESDGISVFRSIHRDAYEYRYTSYLKREYQELHWKPLERFKSKIRRIYYNIYFYFNREKYDD